MRALPLAALLSALPVSALAHLSRPTNMEPEPLQYDPGDIVRSAPSPSGNVQVHYVEEGRHRADIARVQSIAIAYDEAWRTFTSTLGFAPPLSDGDPSLDVYVLETEMIPGGLLIEGCPIDTPSSCWGFIVHPVTETDDALFAKRALFRAILARYRTYADRPLEVGTASWAAEDETLFGAYLAMPERALGDGFGSEDGGTALFVRFLADRYGKELVRELWEAIAAAVTTPDWRELLDALLV